MKKKAANRKKQSFISKIKNFLSTKNYTIFDMFEEHVNLSYSATKLLDMFVKKMCSGEKYSDLAKKITYIERRDDELVNKINFEIYKGRLLPYTSEDWFNLADDIDDLTDMTEIAVRSFDSGKIKIPSNVKRNLTAMSSEMLKTVDMLVHAVSFMKENLNKARESAMKIDNQREKVRDYEFDIISKLTKSNINAIAFAQLKEFVIFMAKIADKAESISDRIAAMSVKYSF